jgi:hypothetical protein
MLLSFALRRRASSLIRVATGERDEEAADRTNDCCRVEL